MWIPCSNKCGIVFLPCIRKYSQICSRLCRFVYSVRHSPYFISRKRAISGWSVLNWIIDKWGSHAQHTHIHAHWQNPNWTKIKRVWLWFAHADERTLNRKICWFASIACFGIRAMAQLSSRVHSHKWLFRQTFDYYYIGMWFEMIRHFRMDFAVAASRTQNFVAH